MLGAALAVGLVASGVLEHRSSGASDAAARFLADFERSRQVTYALEGEFTRTSADGAQIRSALFVAQRAPDRVRRQMGSVSGRLGNEWVNCATDPNGAFSCAPGGVVAPYDEEVASDVAAMATYVEGDRPAYTVRGTTAGCYELELERVLADPLYGVFSRQCFDQATGALRELEVRRSDGSSDLLTSGVLRAEVTDADFLVEADDRFRSEVVAPG